MAPLGMQAPAFDLPDTAGRRVGLTDYRDHPALLLAFLCSHCDYTRHIRHGLATFAAEHARRGLATVGINANDALYPVDASERMAEEREAAGYTFPYLFDEQQQLAKACHAACTPDFFLFDSRRQLVYRGRFDGSRPGSQVPVSGAELRAAADALLDGANVPSEQKPSMGCNIKWRSGLEPDYFRPSFFHRLATAVQRRLSSR
jgi:peroxiredoxin